MVVLSITLLMRVKMLAGSNAGEKSIAMIALVKSADY